MTLPVRLIPEALAEFDHAVDWYEDKRPGLSAQFVIRIREALARIGANPRLHSVVYRDIRKSVIPKYPYIVLYREEPTEVIVISVFHTSRDPSEWQRRV